MIAALILAIPPSQAQTTSGPVRGDRSGTVPLPAVTPAATPDIPYRPRITAPRPLFADQVLEDEVAVLIQAGEDTTLSSQMGGRILKVNASLGSTFATGDTLLEFDCSEQQAQLQAAEAEYRGARETHLTKLKLQALGAAGELEVTVAAAAADKNKSQVDLREAQMAYCKVKAPFSGRVARLRVKVAESVNLGQPLIELVNTTSLKTQMFVPASYIRTLRPGTAFQVRFDDNKVYKARVSKLNSRVEGVSQQLEVEGRFEGSTTGLLPGMVGTAIFSGRPGAK